jgi:ABC-type Mn2+/Zn2+ transport system permease subunit
MGVSCVLSTAFSLGGLALAVRFNLTAGAVIILVASAVYLASLLLPSGGKK